MSIHEPFEWVQFSKWNEMKFLIINVLTFPISATQETIRLNFSLTWWLCADISKHDHVRISKLENLRFIFGPFWYKGLFMSFNILDTVFCMCKKNRIERIPRILAILWKRILYPIEFKYLLIKIISWNGELVNKDEY